MSEDKTICPHCGVKMKKWRTPPQSPRSSGFCYVCFNDECKYYVRGWEHMSKTTQVACSCRHRYDPESGTCGHLPVWSADAGKNDIID